MLPPSKGDVAWSTYVFFFFFFFFLFRATPAAYGSSQARVELELQLLVCTAVKATPDLSHTCDLHCSSRQRWILNPLAEARDQTHILTETMLGP